MRNINSGDEETNSAIQTYIGQIEELNNKLAQAEGIYFFLFIFVYLFFFCFFLFFKF